MKNTFLVFLLVWFVAKYNHFTFENQVVLASLASTGKSVHMITGVGNYFRKNKIEF